MQLPDSLVLKNGEGFGVHASEQFYGELNMSSEAELFETQAIYYDGRYKIDLKALPEDRKLQNLTLYLKENHDGNTYIFILTPEDYDYAVKHGTDLGADRQLSGPLSRSRSGKEEGSPCGDGR